MPLTNRKRPRVGDVIEIATPCGLAYAHATHEHPEFSYLLRVVPGTHKQRPSDFRNLVAQEPQFILFFPLGSACHRNIVRVVAEEEVPAACRSFPTFRAAGARARDGTVLNWFLWDGDRQWPANLSSQELATYPIRSIWNDTLLIERICSKWRSNAEV